MTPNAVNDSLYRGLAVPIQQATTGPEILKATGLDWKVTKVPVEFTYNGVRRKREDLDILIREDNGRDLAHCSNRFHIHQNDEIIGGLAKLAEIGNIKITHGGAIDGGARVFLHGSINKQFDAGVSKKLKDIVRLDFTLSGSHRPGHPSLFNAMGMRLSCLNGAVMTGEKAGFRLTHLSDFKQVKQEEMEAFVQAMILEFETFEQKAKRLRATALNTEQTQCYVTELVQPDLLKAIAAKEGPVENLTGAQILENVMTKDKSRNTLSQLISGDLKDEDLKVDRTVKQILNVVDTQPGAELAKATAWAAYNAVTYFVDHVRGRDNDASVVSALAGPGAKLKARALTLAVDYSERRVN